MLPIPYQHQRWTRTERGNSWGMCAPILAADAMQGGSRVRPVGRDAHARASGLSLLSSPCRLGAGFGRRPFPHSSSAEVSSSVLSVIAQPSTARGGCLSSLTGSRQISRGSAFRLSRCQRVRRGGSAFVAAPTSRPLTFQPGHHVLQDITDVPENHSVKTLSVCRLSENDNTREAPENDRKAFGEFRNV